MNTNELKELNDSNFSDSPVASKQATESSKVNNTPTTRITQNNNNFDQNMQVVGKGRNARLTPVPTPTAYDTQNNPNLQYQSGYSSGAQGLDAIVETPYGEEYFDAKWMGINFGAVNKSTGDPYVGRNPFSSNIDFEHLRRNSQSTVGASVNTATQFVGKTLVNTVGGVVGGFYSIGSALANWDSSKIYDNSVNRALDKATEWVDENNSVFTSQKAAAQNTLIGFDVETLKNLSDGFSFIAGAVLSELATAGMASGAIALSAGTKLARIGKLPLSLATSVADKKAVGLFPRLKSYGEAVKRSQDALELIDETNRLTRNLTQAERAERLATVLGNTTEVISDIKKYSEILRNYGRVGRELRTTVTGSFWEAGLEARQAKDEFLETNLKNAFYDIDNMNVSEEEKIRLKELKKIEIEKLAENAGLLTFGLNVAVLKTSNNIQFPSVFGSPSKLKPNQFANQFKKLINGKYELPKGAKFSDVGRYFGALIKNAATEGAEELAQGIISGTSQEYYKDILKSRTSDKLLQDQTVSFLNSLGNTLEKKVDDRDFWREGVIGAVMGAFGLPMLKKNKNGKLRSIKMQGGIWQDIQDVNEYRQNRNLALTKLNSLDNDLDDINGYNVDRAKRLEMLNRRDDLAMMTNNDQEFEDNRQHKIFNLVTDAKNKGLSDYLDESLEEINSMSLAEYEARFGFEKGTLTKEMWEADKKETLDSFKRFSDAYDMVYKNLNMDDIKNSRVGTKMFDLLVHSIGFEQYLNKQLDLIKTNIINSEFWKNLDYTEQELDQVIKNSIEYKSALENFNYRLDNAIDKEFNRLQDDIKQNENEYNAALDSLPEDVQKIFNEGFNAVNKLLKEGKTVEAANMQEALSISLSSATTQSNVEIDGVPLEEKVKKIFKQKVDLYKKLNSLDKEKIKKNIVDKNSDEYQEWKKALEEEVDNINKQLKEKHERDTKLMLNKDKAQTLTLSEVLGVLEANDRFKAALLRANIVTNLAQDDTLLRQIDKDAINVNNELQKFEIIYGKKLSTIRMASQLLKARPDKAYIQTAYMEFDANLEQLMIQVYELKHSLNNIEEEGIDRLVIDLAYVENSYEKLMIDLDFLRKEFNLKEKTLKEQVNYLKSVEELINKVNNIINGEDAKDAATLEAIQQEKEQRTKEANDALKEQQRAQEQTKNETDQSAEEIKKELQGNVSGNDVGNIPGAKPVAQTEKQQKALDKIDNTPTPIESEIRRLTNELEQQQKEYNKSKTLGEALKSNKLFTYRGEEGILDIVDGKIIFETKDRVFELGDQQEINNSKIIEFGIEEVKSLNIKLNDDFSIEIDGVKYTNSFKNPYEAVTVSNNNYLVSLKDARGNSVTLTGAKAEQVAYEYKLKEFEENATEEQIRKAEESARGEEASGQVTISQENGNSKSEFKKSKVKLKGGGNKKKVSIKKTAAYRNRKRSKSGVIEFAKEIEEIRKRRTEEAESLAKEKEKNNNTVDNSDDNVSTPVQVKEFYTIYPTENAFTNVPGTDDNPLGTKVKQGDIKYNQTATLQIPDIDETQDTGKGGFVEYLNSRGIKLEDYQNGKRKFKEAVESGNLDILLKDFNDETFDYQIKLYIAHSRIHFNIYDSQVQVIEGDQVADTSGNILHSMYFYAPEQNTKESNQTARNKAQQDIESLNRLFELRKKQILEDNNLDEKTKAEELSKLTNNHDINVYNRLAQLDATVSDRNFFTNFELRRQALIHNLQNNEALPLRIGNFLNGTIQKSSSIKSDYLENHNLSNENTAVFYALDSTESEINENALIDDLDNFNLDNLVYVTSGYRNQTLRTFSDNREVEPNMGSLAIKSYGNTGEVYLIHTTVNGQQIPVKLNRNRFGYNPELVENFISLFRNYIANKEQYNLGKAKIPRSAVNNPLMEIFSNYTFEEFFTIMFKRYRADVSSVDINTMGVANIDKQGNLRFGNIVIRNEEDLNTSLSQVRDAVSNSRPVIHNEFIKNKNSNKFNDLGKWFIKNKFLSHTFNVSDNQDKIFQRDANRPIPFQVHMLNRPLNERPKRSTKTKDYRRLINTLFFKGDIDPNKTSFTSHEQNRFVILDLINELIKYQNNLETGTKLNESDIDKIIQQVFINKLNELRDFYNNNPELFYGSNKTKDILNKYTGFDNQDLLKTWKDLANSNTSIDLYFRNYLNYLYTIKNGKNRLNKLRNYYTKFNNTNSANQEQQGQAEQSQQQRKAEIEKERIKKRISELNQKLEGDVNSKLNSLYSKLRDAKTEYEKQSIERDIEELGKPLTKREIREINTEIDSLNSQLESIDNFLATSEQQSQAEQEVPQDGTMNVQEITIELKNNKGEYKPHTYTVDTVSGTITNSKGKVIKGNSSIAKRVLEKVNWDNDITESTSNLESTNTELESLTNNKDINVNSIIPNTVKDSGEVVPEVNGKSTIPTSNFANHETNDNEKLNDIDLDLSKDDLTTVEGVQSDVNLANQNSLEINDLSEPFEQNFTDSTDVDYNPNYEEFSSDSEDNYTDVDYENLEGDEIDMSKASPEFQSIFGIESDAQSDLPESDTNNSSEETSPNESNFNNIVISKNMEDVEIIISNKLAGFRMESIRPIEFKIKIKTIVKEFDRNNLDYDITQRDNFINFATLIYNKMISSNTNQTDKVNIMNTLITYSKDLKIDGVIPKEIDCNWS